MPVGSYGQQVRCDGGEVRISQHGSQFRKQSGVQSAGALRRTFSLQRIAGLAEPVILVVIKSAGEATP
jgi:hypothetical protein